MEVEQGSGGVMEYWGNGSGYFIAQRHGQKGNVAWLPGAAGSHEVTWLLGHGYRLRREAMPQVGFESTALGHHFRQRAIALAEDGEEQGEGSQRVGAGEGGANPDASAWPAAANG